MIQPRRSNRIRTTAAGSCKTERGFQWDIQLADLSPGGCRVEDPRGAMRLGAMVKLFIAGTGPHHAEVAWRQGDRVGLEFRRTLPDRLFQLLAQEEWEAAQTAEREGAVGLPIRRVL